jgi:hypothetical protein
LIFYQLPQTSSYRHRFSGEADSLARKSRDLMEDNGARVKLKSALVPGEVYRRAVLVPLALSAPAGGILHEQIPLASEEQSPQYDSRGCNAPSWVYLFVGRVRPGRAHTFW